MAIKKKAKAAKGSKQGNKKRMSTATKVEIGAGVLAVAAAAGAGYYFYGDKNAKKHRQAASKWAKDMKQEVVREAKNVKKLDQKAMARIVDRAAAMYQGVRSVDPQDLRRAAAELKRNWREVQREVQNARGSARNVKKQAGSARKTVRKTAKKTSAKAAPKKRAKKAAKKRSR